MPQGVRVQPPPHAPISLIFNMNKPIEISASILAADLGNLARDIKRCEAAGAARFHIDCMDGHFVPNLTIGPLIVEACAKHTKLPLEAHLMIEHPGDYIESYAKAGADIIQLQVECYGQRPSSCRQWNQCHCNREIQWAAIASWATGNQIAGLDWASAWAPAHRHSQSPVR